MNNLIRTLTESHAKDAFPGTDLKLLLTTVKEGRRQSHDAKLSDPFYDALEGLLTDLKAVTMDNRDAEAFLKPVSKAEVADYYDVIQNPMDFQTMLKKVKQKQYKSKREFEDDLDLIWSNCNTYNAAENHPLRQCVKRLKVKADALLKHITDRKERTDPAIPQELAASPSQPGTSSRTVNGINGYINGYTHGSHQRSPSYPSVIKHPPVAPGNVARKRMVDLPFAETTAIVRTPQGMVNFRELDRQLAKILDGEMGGASGTKGVALAQKLHDLAPPFEMDLEDAGSPDEMAMAVDGPTGEKRKLNGVDHRPRKRTRLGLPYPLPVPSEREQLSELWWAAVQSDAMLANGLPEIPFASSSTVAPDPHHGVALTTHPQFGIAGSSSASRPPKAKKKKRPEEEKPKALLTLMNNNIKTMKRVRHTHAKFAALNLTTMKDEEGAEGGDNAGGLGGLALPGSSGVYGGGLPPSNQPGSSMLGGPMGPSAADEDFGALDEKVDERAWRIRGKGKNRVGVEIGEQNANDCARWMGQKVLEHAGFQGTTKVALDVLVGVTTEYLYNVGRTLRFLSDKYAQTMTPEEIILHTLFESGTAKIQDMERYISDDIQRHGSRLGDLEKKLVSAYHESTASDVIDEEGLFESDEDEETMAMGDFADILGEDYLGLRALGILDEHPMSSTSIPKKLLRKKANQRLLSAAAKPKEPPPPYPPPPPLLPLTSDRVDDQIGLLKHYYQCRFATLAIAAQPSAPQANGALGPGPLAGPGIPPSLLPPLPGPSLPSLPGPRLGTPMAVDGIKTESTPTPFQGMGEMQVVARIDLILPDDTPAPAQVKMGPLGQILKAGGGSGPAKKKSSNKSGGTSGGASGGSGSGGGDGSAPARETTAPPGPITVSTSMSGSTAVAVTPGPSGPVVNGDVSKKSKKGGGTGTGHAKKKKVADVGAIAIAPSNSGSGQPLLMTGVVVPTA